MKKIIIALCCALVLGGSIGAILYFDSLPKEPVYYSFPGLKEGMTSDIADSQKHVVLTPHLKLSGRGHERYLQENDSIMRSVILFAVREKTEDELTANAGVDTLSSEILDKLSEHMDVSFIESVFFSSFYIA